MVVLVCDLRDAVMAALGARLPFASRLMADLRSQLLKDRPDVHVLHEGCLEAREIRKGQMGSYGHVDDIHRHRVQHLREENHFFFGCSELQSTTRLGVEKENAQRPGITTLARTKCAIKVLSKKQK